MALKGFGPNTYRNRRPMKFHAGDYIALIITVILSTYPFWVKHI